MNLLSRRSSKIVPTVLALLALGTVPASAAALLNVHADVAAGRDARASLTFDGGVPSYRIYGNGSSDVSLVLLGTTRAANAAASIAGKDSLKSITIEQLGDSIAVTFHTASSANISVTNGNGQSLLASLHASAADAGADNFGGSPPSAPSAAPAPGSAAGALMEVVPLKYADVGEIVGLLVAGQQIASNDTFSPQEQNFGTSYGGVAGFGSASIGAPLTAQSGSQTGAAVSGAGTLGQQINENIGIDRRLNAIVLSGTQDVIDGYKAKIEKIDIPLSSVVLETQIVELTDSAARDVGIDFTNAGGPIASGTFEIKTDTKGTGTIDLQAAVYPQIAKGEGRTIARPRIVAQNGSSAQILTGDALPIVTSIAVSGVNAVSQQVQYVNVGVSLQIQPRISSDGFVTSHLFSEVSSVTGYQQGYPTLSQREATTTATVKDGEPFVIGGLLQNDELRSLAKVPGIGDLPLIGWLFRVRHDQSKSTNLYIIVTPHILTNGNPVPAGVPSR
jgi:general secretion pathway protein D